MIYGYIIGLRTEITDEEIPGIEDNTQIPLNIQDVIIAPVMFFLLVNRDSSLLLGIHYTWLDYMAAFIFAVASTTDFFDGYIARTFNENHTHVPSRNITCGFKIM